MANVTKIVEPKNGIFLLNGKIKIERFDELNYIIKIKSDKPIKDRVLSTRGVNYVYKSDGYKRYKESYFSSIEQALSYVIEKTVPDLALDKGSYCLEDILNEMKESKKIIVNELRLLENT